MVTVVYTYIYLYIDNRNVPYIYIYIYIYICILYVYTSSKIDIQYHTSNMEIPVTDASPHPPHHPRTLPPWPRLWQPRRGVGWGESLMEMFSY